MRTILKAAITVCLVICTLNSMAADADGNYAVWAAGRKSCFSFSQALETGDFDYYQNYALGYLTAYNTLTPETYNISGKLELAEIMEWLADYCENHAMQTFEQALMGFNVQHYDSRQKQPPRAFTR